MAPSRTVRYLEAEIRHVLDKLSTHDSVLELGCGYGRVLRRIRQRSASVVGIDTSLDSLVLARKDHVLSGVHLAQMNAGDMAFRQNRFDVTVCIQNGISAFKLNPILLIQESLRVTRPGGLCLFSTYSESFWESRLEWFQRQSEEGLVGEIDWDRTKPGTIICKDGFSATTLSVDDFMRLRRHLRLSATVTEVDGSSLFFEVRVNE